jgi:hypothetical protein
MLQRYVYSNGALHAREIYQYEIGVLDLNQTGCTLELQNHRLQIWMSLYQLGQLGMSTTLHTFNDYHMRDFFKTFRKVMRRAPRIQYTFYAPGLDDI